MLERLIGFLVILYWPLLTSVINIDHLLNFGISLTDVIFITHQHTDTRY